MRYYWLLKRNFTQKEINESTNKLSLLGKWCAKEAFIKALSNKLSDGQINILKSPSSPLKDIEIIKSSSKYPCINLINYPYDICKKLNIKNENIKISISYDNDYAIAIVLIV